MLRKVRGLVVPLVLILEGCSGSGDLPTVPPPPPPGTVPAAAPAQGIAPRPKRVAPGAPKTKQENAAS